MTKAEMSRVHAEILAEEFIEMISSYVTFLEICGSVRRKKAIVGDVEIVYQTDNAGSFDNALAVMVEARTIGKADYGGSTRWGAKYKGVLYKGVKIELFRADENNLGYIQWLRTGPGDANRYVMTRLAQEKALVRPHDGYLWTVAYDDSFDGFLKSKGFAPYQKLNIQTEIQCMQCLGMDYLAPMDRSEIAYRRFLGREYITPDIDWLNSLVVPDDDLPAAKQMAMF